MEEKKRPFNGYSNQKPKEIIMRLLLSITLIIFASCSQMTQKSPRLNWNEKFYWMRLDKPGFIYERDCQNRVGDRRDCEELETNLIEEWSKFAPGFIVIPYKLVYP